MGFADRLKEIFPKTITARQGPVEDTVYIDVPTEIFVKELAVYTATSLIANAISQSEIKVYKGGESVKDEDYFSLNIKPNKNESASQFWHKVVEKMLRSEKGVLCFISGRELYCADDFTLEQKRPFLGNIYSGVVVDGLTLQRKFTANDIFLFKLENIQARKLIDGMYQEYGQVIASAMEAYRDTNASKYVLKIDAIQAGDENFNKEWEEILKEPLRRYINGEAKVYIQYQGKELSKLKSEGSQKGADDTIKLVEQSFKIAGEAFKIPQSLMLGNITNMNDVVKSFLTFGVDPYADMMGKVLTGQYGMESWMEGNYFRVDTSTVNHVDIFDMADKIDKLISSSFACIDEVREKAGLDTLEEEWSRRHLLTKNYEFIDKQNLQGGDESGEGKDDDAVRAAPGEEHF